MTSINIPASVQFIREKAFIDCSNLTNISVDNNNANYKSIDGVLYSKNETNILCYPVAKEDKNCTILNSVTEIGSCAFPIKRIYEVMHKVLLKIWQCGVYHICYNK